MDSGYALPKTAAINHARAHHHLPSFHAAQIPQPASTSQHPHAHDHAHAPSPAPHSHSHSYSHSHSHSPSSHAHEEEHDHFNTNGLAHPAHGRSQSQRLSVKAPAMDHGDDVQFAPSPRKHVSSSWFSLPEALTGLLLPFPYLLASVAYSSSATADAAFPPLSAYAKLQEAFTGNRYPTLDDQEEERSSSLMQACTLTSGTLLLVGILARIRMSGRVLDRRKNGSSPVQQHASRLLATSSVIKMLRAILSLALPFYAAIELGGMRTALVIVTAMASDLICSETHPSAEQHQHWRQMLSPRSATLAAALCGALADCVGLTFSAQLSTLILGYLALAASILVFQPAFPVSLSMHAVAESNGRIDSPVNTPAPWTQSVERTYTSSAVSPLIATPLDVSITFAAGGALAISIVLASMMFSLAHPVHVAAMIFSTLSMAATAGLIMFAQPSALRTHYKIGLALACLVTAASSFLFSPSIWPGTVANGALSALSYVGVLYDTSSVSAPQVNNDHGHDDHGHDHSHAGHSHHHHPALAQGKVSFLTAFLLARMTPGSLAHGILSEKDSRRIAYFTCLNFAYMLVQAFYGWLSGSLGLLSDTVHMFFDCLALIVGLGAAVASKWPTSPEKPYGWGKLNTLAGFGNGIFLMLVSVEFVWEAIEGMMEGRELRHVEELLVVSTLGFLVNLVGLFAFGHAHAGHDHGHGHSHDHPHHDAHTPHDHSSAAHHHGGNENMHGIYLHIAADAGGSLAVILSTLMTLLRPWYLWDPLATIIIALLIFMAAVPLVRDSGRKLLLVIPEELEWSLKTALQELVAVRGVAGYAVPRFWVEDRDASADGNDHDDRAAKASALDSAGALLVAPALQQRVGHHDHAHHDHDHSHNHSHQAVGDAGAGAATTTTTSEQKVLGVIHVFASRAADLDDVRARVVRFFADRNMDVVVQVEREGEGRCWCGGGVRIR